MPKKELSPDQIAKEWIELKADQKRIEQRLEELKPQFVKFLRRTLDEGYLAHGHKFFVVEFEKESFSLAKAKEKIDGRILSPYITVSDVTQVRMTWQGGVEAAAA